MPKHRGTVFTVVRENRIIENIATGTLETWVFGGIVGTYASIHRADEVAAASHQHVRDQFPGIADDFRFTVKPSTWYDE
jgi:hypothetical protein